jgi:hypothetical protein
LRTSTFCDGISHELKMVYRRLFKS